MQGAQGSQACLGWPRGLGSDQQSRGVSGVAGLRGRSAANPTNLIRVMPAEGDEMRDSGPATRDNVAQIRGGADRAAARALAARPLHHQRGGAEFYRQCAARGGLRAVDDAVGRGDRRLRLPRATRCWSISAPSTVSGARPPRSRSKPRRRRSVPWVLDPVFIDRSAARAAFARDAARACAEGGTSQRRGIYRSVRQRAGARRAGGLCARNEKRDRAVGRDRSGRRRRAAGGHRQWPPADGQGDRHGLRRLGAGRGLSRRRTGCLARHCRPR